jgi:periplasmic divalent cation tolerance protein
MKTAARRVAALEKEVLRLHSYETPEFLVMEIAAGSDDYLSWLQEVLKAE